MYIIQIHIYVCVCVYMYIIQIHTYTHKSDWRIRVQYYSDNRAPTAISQFLSVCFRKPIFMINHLKSLRNETRLPKQATFSLCDTKIVLHLCELDKPAILECKNP